MEGGIIETITIFPDIMHLIVKGTGNEKKIFMRIKVAIDKNSEQLEPGDSIWWYGKRAFFTRPNTVLGEGEISLVKVGIAEEI